MSSTRIAFAMLRDRRAEPGLPHSGMRRAAFFAMAAIAAMACAIGLFATPAAADGLVNVPAEKFLITPGGVDMRTGRYAYGETDVSIGGGEGTGLALVRAMPDHAGNHANPFSNFSHNWDMWVLETRVDLTHHLPTGNDYRMTVHIGGRAHTFEALEAVVGYEYKSEGGPVAHLEFAGGARDSAAVFYTYTAPDGTIMTFRPIGNGDCADQFWSTGPRRCAFVSDITEPDGTKYSFDYAAAGAGTGNRARLRLVTSSRGYALLLEGSGSFVTRACVLNLARTIIPANGLCPAGAPAATYAYRPDGTTPLASATNAANAVSNFTYTPAGSHVLMGFIKPGQTAPWLTNEVAYMYDEESTQQEIVVAQTFADGQHYAYEFEGPPITNSNPNPTVAGGIYRDAANHATELRFDFPIRPGTGPHLTCHQQLPNPCTQDSPDQFEGYLYQQTPGPVMVTDPLNRVTTFDYCDPALVNVPPANGGGCLVSALRSFTDPEHITTVLEYDGLRNITKVTRYPKPNSPAGTPVIVTSATYDVANPKSATKPLSTTDANQHVTTYQYAPEHGGVLRETGPPVNGVTPQKRYHYEARYAWISNGAGGYGPVSSPIYVLTQTSFCKSGNPNSTNDGCANGASDEVITTYDYGPDSGPNNLLLRGTVVDAGGLNLRTCYSYDALGNKISETRPRAGLTSCP